MNKKILFIVVLFSAAMFAYLWAPKDVSLSETAKAWGELDTQANEQGLRSYYYLLGINAHPNRDPAEVGKRIAQFYAKTKSQYSSDKDVHARRTARRNSALAEINSSNKKRLTAVDAGFFVQHCDVLRDDCVYQYLVRRDYFDNVLANHEFYVDRYQQFMDFNEYQEAYYAQALVGLGALPELSSGAALNRLAIVQRMSSGDAAAALTMLEHDIERIRAHLTMSHALWGKLTLLKLLAHDLDLLANFAHHGYIKSPSPIRSLSLEERSFSKVAPVEFRTSRASWEAETNLWRRFLSAIGIGYRNVYLNANAYSWQEIARLSEVDPQNLLSELEQAEQTSDQLIQQASEDQAIFLLLSSLWDPGRYLARAHNVDGKIKLVNAVLASSRDYWQSDSAIDEYPGDISSPYDASQKPYFSDDGLLCHEAPFEPLQVLRKTLLCVRVQR